MNQTPPTPPPRRVRATVTVGDTETGYLRAGCGQAVLLLAAPQTIGSSANGSGALDRLVDTLAPHCRVFVPDADPALPFSDWLRGFMDGLGLVSASLVVDDDIGAHALDFVRTHPERVDRMAIVRSDAPPLIIVSFVGSDGGLIDASHAIVRFLTDFSTT